MTHDLEQHLTDAAAAVAAAGDLGELQQIEGELLGKSSVVTEARRSLGGMEHEERKQSGRRLNEVRAELETLVIERRAVLEAAERAKVLEAERLDLTEFDRGQRLGHRHVVTQTWERLEDIFVGMGFTVIPGL